MMSICVRAGVAAVVLAALAGCASDQASVERGGVRGGTYACEGQPGMTLVVSADGAYELRWGQGAAATGWLEASGDQLKPTSGPLQGVAGRRTADGISFPGGSVCSSFRAAS
jgi:hypothetical protein